jgi:hypothetical protein
MGSGRRNTRSPRRVRTYETVSSSRKAARRLARLGALSDTDGPLAIRRRRSNGAAIAVNRCSGIGIVRVEHGRGRATVLPTSGEVVRVTRAASVQFHRPMVFRVIRVLDWNTYDGWAWLEGYQLNSAGDAVERRDIFVQLNGLQPATDRRGRASAGSRRDKAKVAHRDPPGTVARRDPSSTVARRGPTTAVAR